MFSPGASVAWNFPRRSTTQACCCGTTFSERTTKMAAMTNRMIAISMVLLRLWSARARVGSAAWRSIGRLQHQLVAVHGDDHVHARPRRTAAAVARRPGGAAVRHTRG